MNLLKKFIYLHKWRKKFSCATIFVQLLFPNYIFLRQMYLTDTEIRGKIHLREWNRNFDRSNFPNSIVPTRNQKYLVYYSPNNHSNTSNCIGVARTKSNSPQSARSGQSFVTTSTIFLVVAFARLIYSAGVRDRYNWSSVRVVNEIKSGKKKKRTKIKRSDENKWTNEKGGKRWKEGRKKKKEMEEEGTQIQRDRLSGYSAVRVPCLQPFNCVYLHG